jgi:hypothetical protein
LRLLFNLEELLMADKKAPDGSKKRLVILLAGLLVLIICGTVMAVMGRDTSPDLEQVKQMRKDLFDKMKDKDLTAEQRKDMWKQYGETVKSLPFDKRKQLYQEKMQKSMKRLEGYYGLGSDEERKAYLDKQIQDGDQRRKDRDAKRDANGDNPRPQRGQGGQTPPGDNPDQASTDGNSNGRQGRDGALADQGHRDSLQMSTPEQRAAQADYRYQIKQEAQALGLPVPRGGGGGPGGGRGGGGPRGGGGGGPPAGGGTPPPPVGP